MSEIVWCPECGLMVYVPPDSEAIHPECRATRELRTAVTSRWWHWHNLKLNIRLLPKFVWFHLQLWFYLYVLINRPAYKHGQTHPQCVMNSPMHCVTFRYRSSDTYDLEPLGFFCNVCGYIIEGSWREMGGGSS